MQDVGDKVISINNLTFIVRPHQTIVKTSLQTFYLKPKANYWVRRMNKLRVLIEAGAIVSLNDLAGYCEGKIEWCTTAIDVTVGYNKFRYKQ